MIVPMLSCSISAHRYRVAATAHGIAVTVGINWLVKPFALLTRLVVHRLIFRPRLPAGQIDSISPV
jgi:ACR3 family arsenite transporter